MNELTISPNLGERLTISATPRLYLVKLSAIRLIEGYEIMKAGRFAQRILGDEILAAGDVSLLEAFSVI